MDGLRARLLRRRDDRVTAQVRFSRRAGPDMYRLVGHAHVQRLGIGIRVDRDRADSHPPRSPDHPARNLAAIGNEERSDHALASEKMRFARLHRWVFAAEGKASPVIIALHHCSSPLLSIKQEIKTDLIVELIVPTSGT